MYRVLLLSLIFFSGITGCSSRNYVDDLANYRLKVEEFGCKRLDVEERFLRKRIAQYYELMQVDSSTVNVLSAILNAGVPNLVDGSNIINSSNIATRKEFFGYQYVYVSKHIKEKCNDSLEK